MPERGKSDGIPDGDEESEPQIDNQKREVEIKENFVAECPGGDDHRGSGPSDDGRVLGKEKPRSRERARVGRQRGPCRAEGEGEEADEREDDPVGGVDADRPTLQVRDQPRWTGDVGDMSAGDDESAQHEEKLDPRVAEPEGSRHPRDIEVFGVGDDAPEMKQHHCERRQRPPRLKRDEQFSGSVCCGRLWGRGSIQGNSSKSRGGRAESECRRTAANGVGDQVDPTARHAFTLPGDAFGETSGSRTGGS